MNVKKEEGVKQWLIPVVIPKFVPSKTASGLVRSGRLGLDKGKSLLQAPLQKEEMVESFIRVEGNSFDDNTTDTMKNVFDLRALVGDLTSEEDTGSSLMWKPKCKV
ncbi:hypothetical protein Dsin_016161 [Dipteronia sinensis]|uniref:Uncharacterized protein n=1 Tax=Dipteronia sinensis TaxID=43782 RepID=A0AAE0ACK0_9ROSI|nr:hypothetical protein Dsin_016161 [Dipteronia sinensis]